MRKFHEFACFDWSGQAVARPRGIALATIAVDHGSVPKLVARPGGWRREDALDWVIARADEQADMLIAFDLSPAFPFVDCGAYFPHWEDSPPDARSLWALVDRVCADDPHLAATSFVTHPQARRYFRHGRGDCGDRFGIAGTGRLRAVEHHQRATRQANSASCFNLVGAAQVGKSSLTGMRLFHRLAGRVPIWPFDPVPATGPLIVEIYTTMAARAARLPGNRSKLRDERALASALGAFGAPPPDSPAPDDHAADAILTAAWLRGAATRTALWRPPGLTAEIRATEGWTFGVA